MNAMTAHEIVASGTSPEAITVHYEIGDAFYKKFLDPTLAYSSGLWNHGDADDTLDAAMQRRMEYFGAAIQLPENARVLDVGCGWGGPLDWIATTYGIDRGIGLTLNAAHERAVHALGNERITVRREPWAHHEPEAHYNAVVVLESMEHFARYGLDRDAKIRVYTEFFRRCYEWLVPGGRVALQTFCLENVGDKRSLEPTKLTKTIREDIYPEAMLPNLSELVCAWERYFALEQLQCSPDDYIRTLREWSLRLRANRDGCIDLVGRDVVRDTARYLAAAESLFRTGEWTLYRIVLARRDNEKE